jgi:hypothetical protein
MYIRRYTLVGMLRSRLPRFLLALALCGLAVVPSSALASVASEQQAGQKLAEQVQTRDRSCKSLSANDLDHIGEFVMGRMIGSTAAHEAMNARMTQAVGAQAESRMHQILGARFVGCTTATGGKNNSTGSSNGNGMMDGGSMMGSTSGSRGWNQGDWGSMMGSGNWQSMMRSGTWTRMMGSSGDWSWMMGSRWKNMTSSDWRAAQQRLLGTATIRATDSGWKARDTALAAFAVILAAGLVGALFAWHPWRRSS